MMFIIFTHTHTRMPRYILIIIDHTRVENRFVTILLGKENKKRKQVIMIF